MRVRATSTVCAALLTGAFAAHAQVKPITPAPIKKTVVMPTAPKAAMPIVITTARLSFTGTASGPVRITTAPLSFAGPLPGGLVIATAGLSFVGGRTKGIATPAITFVGTSVAPRTITTDPISFSGPPHR